MACEPIRFLDREVTQNEIENYKNWWTEQLYQYGTNVWYYSKGYSLSGHDWLYGEDLSNPFDQPRELVLGINITNDSSMLSKFGILLDSDATAWIPIDAYKDVFGPDAEPKSGDVIELAEVGVDRPYPRGNPKYEITQRDDDDIPAGINPLMGHYVWFVKLKRFEYSHEPGIEPEPGTPVVSLSGDQPDNVIADDVKADTAVSAVDVYKDDEDNVYGQY